MFCARGPCLCQASINPKTNMAKTLWSDHSLSSSTWAEYRIVRALLWVYTEEKLMIQQGKEKGCWESGIQGRLPEENGRYASARTSRHGKRLWQTQGLGILKSREFRSNRKYSTPTNISKSSRHLSHVPLWTASLASSQARRRSRLLDPSGSPQESSLWMKNTSPHPRPLQRHILRNQLNTHSLPEGSVHSPDSVRPPTQAQAALTPTPPFCRTKS